MRQRGTLGHTLLTEAIVVDLEDLGALAVSTREGDLRL